MSPPRPQVALTFAMRRFPDDEAPSSEALFRETLRMTRWADGKMTAVAFAEHHVTGDGFMTSPLLLSAAAAAVTERLHIGVLALLLPLHDPVLVAEEITNLDLISGGRHRTVLGLGYRPPEYQALGVDWSLRGRIFDQKTATLVSLLRGHETRVRGLDVVLDHLPRSAPDQIVLMGGNSVRAARRAAEHRLGFVPAVADPRIEASYRAHCEGSGYDGYYEVPDMAGYTLLSDDPDKTWESVGRYLLFDAMAYQSIAHSTRVTMLETNAQTIDALRASGTYQILTPDEALAEVAAGRDLSLAPLVGGLPPEVGWETLTLYEERVLPEIEPSVGLFERALSEPPTPSTSPKAAARAN